MFENKKTYATAGLIAVVTFAQTMGWVTPEAGETITTLLLGGGLAFLRSAVAKK